MTNDAKKMIKDKMKPFKTYGNKKEGEIGDVQKDLVAYETDLYHFLEILNSVYKEIKIVEKEMEKSINKKSDSYFIDEIENLSFKEQFERFKLISTKIKEKEKEFLSYLKKIFFVKMEDMKDDLTYVIVQIEKTTAYRQEFKKDIMNNTHENYNFKKEKIEKDEKTFLNELKRFSNQFDINLKEVINDFFCEVNQLDNLSIVKE